MKKTFILTALLLGATVCHAQAPEEETVVVIEAGEAEECSLPADSAERPLYRWMVEGNAATSSRHTPFWLMNNRMGLSSLEKNNGYMRAGFFREMQHDSRFSWGFGADIAVPYNYTSHFVIQQLYGEIRYRSLELTIGSKERYIGVVNEELGSGDMTFSQNARPVPQVFLSMPKYEWVPWTKQMLAVKGFFSMGMLSDWRWQRDHVGPDGNWAEHVLYHTKGLFLRWGNREKLPLMIEGGFEMGTLFGGKAHRGDKVINMPTDLKNIIKAMLGMSGGDSGDPSQAGEISNCYGDHVGEWSLAATWAPKETDWSVRAYYQHFFEDHSQLFFDYAWKDMLLGVEFTLPKNRFVDQFVYEYLNTKDQSGAVYWDHTPDLPEQVSGADNYYNHYIYNGWQHWGMGLGNPLLISPIYNSNGSISFRHNRVKGHHFGVSGSPTDELHYRILMSMTRSWGTYATPLPNVERNFNAMVEMTYSPRRLAGWDFRLGLGADGGKMLGKTLGAMLTIRKTGWL